MRNQKLHEDKFMRKLDSLDDLLKNPKNDQEWCTREGAKDVIDDLTDKEFEVLTSVLGHLFVLSMRPQRKRKEKAFELYRFG